MQMFGNLGENETFILCFLPPPLLKKRSRTTGQGIDGMQSLDNRQVSAGIEDRKVTSCSLFLGRCK